jgi:hypothetical protein
MSKAGPALALGALVAAAVALTRVPAVAHGVPSPCDFITGGGFIFKDDGSRANFGVHEGCKKNGPDAPFWGHLNYVDHGGYLGKTPYHVNSTSITGYLVDDPGGDPSSTARDTCGIARDNLGRTLRFRTREVDNGEGSNATAPDQFGIILEDGYCVSTRDLAGGNIQLHKPNPSTPAPSPAPSEFDMCHGLPSPVVCP